MKTGIRLGGHFKSPRIGVSGREGEKGSDSGWLGILWAAPIGLADGVDVGYERRVENGHVS